MHINNNFLVKFSLVLLLPLFLLFSCHPAKKATESTKRDGSGQYFLHRVEKNETLYSVSKKYNVTVEELESLNPSLKKGVLKAGMLLRVPEKKTETVKKTEVEEKEKEKEPVARTSF